MNEKLDSQPANLALYGATPKRDGFAVNARAA
jgi:hypothetical protein